MATIRVIANGKYRADIRKCNTFIQAKTFSTIKQAEQWILEVETNIVVVKYKQTFI